MSKTKVSASKAGTKHKAPPHAWKPGQSGNPKGRPKDAVSWAKIIAEVGDSFPDDVLAFIGNNNDLGKQIAKFPKNVQMKYLVTARVFAALMFEPTAGLWNGLMDRAEGKVPDRVQFDGKLNVENLVTALEKIYGRNDTSK